eukprot:SAG11_NODE_2391_length_3412_cov_1.952309_4_plen_63_part_00
MPSASAPRGRLGATSEIVVGGDVGGTRGDEAGDDEAGGRGGGQTPNDTDFFWPRANDAPNLA